MHKSLSKLISSIVGRSAHSSKRVKSLKSGLIPAAELCAWDLMEPLPSHSWISKTKLNFKLDDACVQPCHHPFLNDNDAHTNRKRVSPWRMDCSDSDECRQNYHSHFVGRDVVCIPPDHIYEEEVMDEQLLAIIQDMTSLGYLIPTIPREGSMFEHYEIVLPRRLLEDEVVTGDYETVTGYLSIKKNAENRFEYVAVELLHTSYNRRDLCNRSVFHILESVQTIIGVLTAEYDAFKMLDDERFKHMSLTVDKLRHSDTWDLFTDIRKSIANRKSADEEEGREFRFVCIQSANANLSHMVEDDYIHLQGNYDQVVGLLKVASYYRSPSVKDGSCDPTSFNTLSRSIRKKIRKIYRSGLSTQKNFALPHAVFRSHCDNMSPFSINISNAGMSTQSINVMYEMTHLTFFNHHYSAISEYDNGNYRKFRFWKRTSYCAYVAPYGSRRRDRDQLMVYRGLHPSEDAIIRLDDEDGSVLNLFATLDLTLCVREVVSQSMNAWAPLDVVHRSIASRQLYHPYDDRNNLDIPTMASSFMIDLQRIHHIGLPTSIILRERQLPLFLDISLRNILPFSPTTFLQSYHNFTFVWMVKSAFVIAQFCLNSREGISFWIHHIRLSEYSDATYGSNRKIQSIDSVYTSVSKARTESYHGEDSGINCSIRRRKHRLPEFHHVKCPDDSIPSDKKIGIMTTRRLHQKRYLMTAQDMNFTSISLKPTPHESNNLQIGLAGWTFVESKVDMKLTQTVSIHPSADDAEICFGILSNVEKRSMLVSRGASMVVGTTLNGGNKKDATLITPPSKSKAASSSVQAVGSASTSSQQASSSAGSAPVTSSTKPSKKIPENVGKLSYKACQTAEGESCIVTLYIPPESLSSTPNGKKRYSDILVVAIDKIPCLPNGSLDTSFRPSAQPSMLSHLYEINDELTLSKSDKASEDSLKRVLQNAADDGFDFKVKPTCPSCSRSPPSDSSEDDIFWMKMNPCGHIVCLDCHLVKCAMKTKRGIPQCVVCSNDVNGSEAVDKNQVVAIPTLVNVDSECIVAFSELGTRRTQYTLGARMHCDDYDRNLSIQCSSGFHAVDNAGDAFQFARPRKAYFAPAKSDKPKHTLVHIRPDSSTSDIAVASSSNSQIGVMDRSSFKEFVAASSSLIMTQGIPGVAPRSIYPSVDEVEGEADVLAKLNLLSDPIVVSTHSEKISYEPDSSVLLDSMMQIDASDSSSTEHVVSNYDNSLIAHAMRKAVTDLGISEYTEKDLVEWSDMNIVDSSEMDLDPLQLNIQEESSKPTVVTTTEIILNASSLEARRRGKVDKNHPSDSSS